VSPALHFSAWLRGRVSPKTRCGGSPSRSGRQVGLAEHVRDGRLPNRRNPCVRPATRWRGRTDDHGRPARSARRLFQQQPLPNDRAYSPTFSLLLPRSAPRRRLNRRRRRGVCRGTRRRPRPGRHARLKAAFGGPLVTSSVRLLNAPWHASPLSPSRARRGTAPATSPGFVQRRERGPRHPLILPSARGGGSPWQEVATNRVRHLGAPLRGAAARAGL
jgi:hypothetical protein